jgi:hypothetical protein
MEAVKLAFDTIIVGALALPWLILIIDVFLRPKGSENVSIWELVLTRAAPNHPAGVLRRISQSASFIAISVARCGNRRSISLGLNKS